MKNHSHAQRVCTSEEISGWLRRYRASELSLGAFAEQHGLSRNQLHYWVYDRRHSQPPKPVAATPIFQELKLPAGGPTPNWAVEIRLPTGTVARFTAAAPPAWISSVLETLPRPC